MRLMMLACCMLVGCAAETEGPPATNYAPLPDGSGWDCFRDTPNDNSACARPGKCAELRANYEAEMKRRGQYTAPSECIPRPAAACFSYRSTLGVDGALCCESMIECGEYRSGALSAPEDWRDVSPCKDVN